MENQFANQQKPPLVNVIAWMTLASGIVNLFWGIIASLTALATIVGIVCVPLTILPTILGVFEIIYAAKLLSNPAQPVLASTNIAVLEIVTILVGNLFSMVVGILALVFYNDLVVKDYFARLNGMPAPVAPLVPVEPASKPDLSPALSPEESVYPAEDRPAPIMSEPEAAPADDSPAPQSEERLDQPKSNDK
jgi:hypothetical protein